MKILNIYSRTFFECWEGYEITKLSKAIYKRLDSAVYNS